MEQTLSIPELQAAADTRYGIGVTCTWSGPVSEAGIKPVALLRFGQVFVCPECGGPLSFALSEEDYWATVAVGEKRAQGYEKMMRWAKGRCYPDAETLLNAYRQAMEE